MEQYLEHGRLSQNLNIEFSLNFPDGKMGKRVTYCASLDEFLDAKFGISHETQEKISKSLNSMECKLANKSDCVAVIRNADSIQRVTAVFFQKRHVRTAEWGTMLELQSAVGCHVRTAQWGTMLELHSGVGCAIFELYRFTFKKAE